ncbi:hypothetical protein [Frigidibacter mobilis]|uniref:Uncharacterized protein n=1 Tax=Frigidibacter mobilis TaxID=1335048 RepID=A0A159Z211_9RHOB|nr:hypothetical protein [Frigidibacter mobilis]AMY69001.1 hypothetical protein AKL17_1749 [Frigidibacter mobilis]
MDILIWIGAAISAAGLVGILWCIVAVARARRAGLEDEALRLRLQKAVTLNLAALMVSMLGLMLVVLGIVLA